MGIGPTALTRSAPHQSRAVLAHFLRGRVGLMIRQPPDLAGRIEGQGHLLVVHRTGMVYRIGSATTKLIAKDRPKNSFSIVPRPLREMAG